MAAISDPFLRSQLEVRRKKLTSAISRPDANAALGDLLREVDSALARMDSGTYGICEQCHDPIEPNRLMADPLIRLCLDHLTAAQQRELESDLQLAAQIQRALLPAAATRSAGWQIHYHWQPLGLVSGDYCDLIDSKTGEVLFFLGDVSGKGVAASMLMTHLHAMFRSLTSMGAPFENLRWHFEPGRASANPPAAGLSLEQMMCLANHVFSQSVTTGQFATLVAGRAASTGEVELVNAGHCPALVVGRQGVRALHSTGLPLGVSSSGCAAFEKVSLEPGETLFLYTDGLSERFNSSGAQYGDQRMTQFLEDHRALAPDALLASCLRDLQSFTAGVPATDDLTLMALRRL